MARRKKMSLKSAVYCCEDHFEPSQDIEEWARYCLLKEQGLPTFRLRVKKDVLPHIFNCQPDRTRAHATPLRSAAKKRIVAETKRIALQPVSDRNKHQTQEDETPLMISRYDKNSSMSWTYESYSLNEESNFTAMTLDTENFDLGDSAALV